MNHQKRKLLLLILLSWCLIYWCTEKIPEGPGRTEILKIRLAIKDNRYDFAQENNWENRYKIPPNNMTQQQFEELAKWRVPFTITAYNDFDEAMDGQKWLVLKVNIWSAHPADTWHAQLIYADTVSNRNMTIPPHDSLLLYAGNRLTWEQRDISGNSIHQTDSYTPIWIDCIEFDSLIAGTKPPELIRWRHCDTTMLAPVDTVIAFSPPKTILAQAEVQLFKNYHRVMSDTLEFRIHYFMPADGFRRKFWCREGATMQGDPPCPF
jgi:hypothetical protein